MHLMKHPESTIRNLLLATSLLNLTAVAYGATVGDGVITSGLCEQRKVEEKYAQPQSTAGYATLGDLAITQPTDTIPLRKGVAFGFTWRAEGLPKVIQIKYVVEHPEITKPDGTKLTRFEEPVERETQHGVLQKIDCYALSEEHELVPGVWSLAIVYEGSVLAKRTFNVVRKVD